MTFARTAFAALTIAAMASPALAQSAGSISSAIKAQCDVITYDDDCLAAMRTGIAAVAQLADADKTTIYNLIRSYTTKHAYLAPRIEQVLTENNIPLTAPPA